MIKVVIVDDEEFARNIIKKVISANFKDLSVVAEGGNVFNGVEVIKKHKPDIVFLDIDMPDGTGFDLLKKISNPDFKLIFVTAHSEHAIRAIKFSALDYVLKPVDVIELAETIEKVKVIVEKESEQLKINTFLSNFDNIANKSKKIVLKTSDNIYVVNIQNIIRCTSENNYTTFYLNDNRKIVISKTLKEYENLFLDFGFVRVHRSHLININYIERFAKDTSYVYMKDASKIPVSHRKKEQLLRFFENL